MADAGDLKSPGFVPCLFESGLRHHVAADDISFAATFLLKSPLTHFVAAPLQIMTTSLGHDLGTNLKAAASILLPYYKPEQALYRLLRLFL